MTAAADRKVAGLYAGLTAAERVRLLARLHRAQDHAETRRLLAATPPEHGPVYNRAVDILARLNLPLGPMIGTTLLAAERDAQALQALLIVRSGQRNRRVYASAVWGIAGYPVTASEYRDILKQQRGEPWPLDRIAGYLADFGAEDAADLHPSVAAWLRGAPDDLRDDEAHDQALSLIEGAVARGELPAPGRSNAGRALPWGAVADWLYQPHPAAYAPPLPVAWVPALDVLGGGWAAWDVRPDGEAAAVRARREELVEVLAVLAHLSAAEAERLDPHPPLTPSAKQQAARRLAGLEPWLPRPELREAALCLGRRHADYRALLRAITAAVDAIQREDFGGEDPLLPDARAALAAAWAQERALEQLWAEAGDDLAADILGNEPWPPLPEQPADREAFYRTRLLEVLWGEMGSPPPGSPGPLPRTPTPPC